MNQNDTNTKLSEIMSTNLTGIKVLLFGPNERGGDIYDKRCEIRQKIQELGYDAHFCEDIWHQEALSASGLNLTVAEYCTAKRYDYVVCLMASPGTIGEFHDFAKDKKIASKMMVCINSKHKNGYTSQGAVRIFEGHNGKIDWFSYPDDITNCRLSTRVLDQIKKVAEAKQWEVATGDII
jgi:predicted amidohydrolase